MKTFYKLQVINCSDGRVECGFIETCKAEELPKHECNEVGSREIHTYYFNTFGEASNFVKYNG